MSDIVHISSLLVSARPEKAKGAAAQIESLPIAEIAHRDEAGKIIVTLETTNESEIVSALSDIQLIDGVVSAALVYHQTDAGGALEANR